MTVTSSRNWDAFNVEERDRRHKEAEERKLHDKFNKPEKRKRTVRNTQTTQLKRNSAGLFLCPKCNSPLKSNRVEKHLEQVHGFKFDSKPKQRRAATPKNTTISKSRADIKIIKRVNATTCLSLVKEFESELAEFILKLARLEGVKVNSTSAPIPISIAEKIRLQVEARLTTHSTGARIARLSSRT